MTLLLRISHYGFVTPGQTLSGDMENNESHTYKEKRITETKHLSNLNLIYP